MANRRKNIRSKNKNTSKIIIIARRMMILILLVSMIIGLKYIISERREFISSDSINYYIDTVDSLSKPKKQLNWKEIAAIDGVKNRDFSIGGNKTKDIAKSFYDDSGKLNNFKDVINNNGFSESDRNKAYKNLENLNKISLRVKKNGESESRDKFIDSMKEESIKAYKKYGIFPSVIISQAILESNWGQSDLSSKYNNYFGIKANSAWRGKIANFSTKENYKDVIKANFRAYDSVKESVDDLGNFLKVNGRYEKNGLFNGVNYKEQCEALEKAGYSTAENEQGEKIYADLLISIIRDNNLMIIDNEACK